MAFTKVELDAMKVEQKRKITIALDKSYEQILALDSDPSVEVEFDYREMPELPDEVVDSLKRETRRKYWVAEAKKKEEKDEKRRNGIELIQNPLGLGANTISHREYIRPRRGYHQYWANPGADFEAKMASGAYKQVRVPTEKQVKEGYEPGYEDGEVLKRSTVENKVEAIALECTEEAYQQYLAWMDQQSSIRYGAIKTNFYEKTEEINRGITRRGARVTPMDVSE